MFSLTNVRVTWCNTVKSAANASLCIAFYSQYLNVSIRWSETQRVIPPLHWFSVKTSHIPGHHSSSQHYPYTKSPPSIHHAQDRLPLVSPLPEVERILRYREAVTQKTPRCLKVSCSLPSVPREMASDNSRRRKGRIHDAAYSVCLACL